MDLDARAGLGPVGSRVRSRTRPYLADGWTAATGRMWAKWLR